jgi:hypothetical protein
MINCVFIQTNELTLEGKKFIYTLKTVYITDIEFKHPNFSIKEGTIHSIFPLLYYYVTKILTNLLLVKMKGNFSKEMAKKVKRKESLKSKPNGSQVALEINCEEK